MVLYAFFSMILQKMHSSKLAATSLADAGPEKALADEACSKLGGREANFVLRANGTSLIIG